MSSIGAKCIGSDRMKYVISSHNINIIIAPTHLSSSLQLICKKEIILGQSWKPI